MGLFVVVMAGSVCFTSGCEVNVVTRDSYGSQVWYLDQVDRSTWSRMFIAVC